MKYILAIAVIIGMTSFVSTSKKAGDPSGLYGECEDGFFACEQVLINPDSTFEYWLFYDVGGLNHWKGTWIQNGDTLILNSNNQPTDSVELKEAKDAFSFYDSGYIIDLKCVIRRKRMYTWDPNEKVISKRRFLQRI